MKKLLVIALLAVSATAFGQVEQGDVMVTFNGSYQKQGDVKFGMFSAKVGKFFTQNIEAGVTPIILVADGFNSTGLGLYGTYNFLTEDGKFLPYLGVQLAYNGTKVDTGDGDFKYSQTDYALRAGAKYFLTENLNIDAGLTYSDDLSNSEDITLDSSIRFEIGVGFILGKLN